VKDLAQASKSTLVHGPRDCTSRLSVDLDGIALVDLLCRAAAARPRTHDRGGSCRGLKRE
jgi:hypothetical protein